VAPADRAIAVPMHGRPGRAAGRIGTIIPAQDIGRNFVICSGLPSWLRAFLLLPDRLPEGWTMIMSDNALLLLAGGMALATLIALFAGMVGPVAWDDDTAREGVLLAAGKAADWLPVVR
jgi:hypothetical protein